MSGAFEKTIVVAVQAAQQLWHLGAFLFRHLQTLFVLYVFFHVWSQTRDLEIEDKGNGARLCIELKAN